MAEEDIISTLESYESNPNMITAGAYSPSAHEYKDNHMPFAEVHLAYLRKNKKVNASQYLSNLKIMITRR